MAEPTSPRVRAARARRRYPDGRKRWIDRNPEKRRAHKLVAEAVAAGTLKRQPCEVCGAADVQGHHEDYRKALEVRWLCGLHHRARHREMREAATSAAE